MRFPRLWPRRRSSQATSGFTSESSDQITPLQQAGQLLKERREQRGLSMRDLSREVRITTPVLEALERGWSDRLPEAAYLGAMLAQLE
ncbi:MAG: DNA-binding protein, partial [Synechococcus sp. TMED187]